MTKIVAFAGKIGAGKTTLRNFLYGYMMKHYVPSLINDVDGMIDTYQIDSMGRLWVPGETNGEVEMGIFDTNTRDPEVVAFMRKHIWPYVKHFSFAGRLKEMALDFGFPEESLYGTQEQKKEPTSFLWEDMVGSNKEGPMSARDFLQYFGTEVCRRYNPLIWANSCIKEIAQWQPYLAIVDDLRFADTELPVIKANEGVSYYFKRDSMKDYQSPHGSEEGICAEDCDVVVNNHEMSIEESCLFVLDDMRKRGILE